MSASKEIERMAAEYCDKPRCAMMSRDSKPWHRSKAAFLAGANAILPDLRMAMEALELFRGISTPGFMQSKGKPADEALAKLEKYK